MKEDYLIYADIMHNCNKMIDFLITDMIRNLKKLRLDLELNELDNSESLNQAIYSLENMQKEINVLFYEEITKK